MADAIMALAVAVVVVGEVSVCPVSDSVCWVTVKVKGLDSPLFPTVSSA